jgi:hypothetical protein
MKGILLVEVKQGFLNIILIGFSCIGIWRNGLEIPRREQKPWLRITQAQCGLSRKRLLWTLIILTLINTQTLRKQTTNAPITKKTTTEQTTIKETTIHQDTSYQAANQIIVCCFYKKHDRRRKSGCQSIFLLNH